MISPWKIALRSLLIIGAALVAIAGWDMATSMGLIMWRPDWADDELVLYLVVKGGFALALALCFTVFGAWRRFGFAGGLAWRYWPALLPLWAAAAISASQGPGVHAPLQLAGWALLAFFIAFGEEAIFRAVIPDALLGNPPVGMTVAPAAARRAIIVSALLFGLAHLAALAIPSLDRHIVIGQTVFATGIGLALAWVRLRSASIWPGLIGHAMLDACGIIASGSITDAMTTKADSYTYLWLMDGASLAWGLLLIFRWPAVPAARIREI
jgi:membrane protease YdiL (CAAX protease family)